MAHSGTLGIVGGAGCAVLAAIFPPALAAQTYRTDRINAIAFEFDVHQALERLPRRLDDRRSYFMARYEPRSERHWVKGSRSARPWVVEVLTFRPDAEQVIRRPARPGQAPLSLESFAEYVSSPYFGNKGKKEIISSGMEATGDQSYVLWQWYQNGYYTRAGVYPLEDGEVAIVVQLPCYKAKRPIQRAMSWAKRMVASGRLVEAPERARKAGNGRPDERDAHADTPEKLEVLERAKTSISQLRGWDYFTTPRFVVLYSWSGERRAQGSVRTHAKRLIKSLDKARQLYMEHFPPDAGDEEPYTVVRICRDQETFQKYSRGAPPGVVGWYSPTSREFVVFRETRNEIPGASVGYVLFHEGWHQYSHAYFGVRMHAWFEEGTAEYFAAFSTKGSRYRPLELRRKHARTIVAGEQWTKLAKFLSAERFPVNRLGPMADYAQAWSLMDFLKRGEKSYRDWDPTWSELLPTYVDHVRRARNPEAALKAAVRGVDLAALEKAWVRWVKSRR